MNRSDASFFSRQGGGARGAKRDSAANRERVNRVGSLVAVLSLAACMMVLAGPELAQGDPIINAAADRLNTITPQAVPQQTIRIGTYDGSTKKFTWNLPEECPQNVPAFKCEEQGGPVKYDH
ncbi:MAG: hypothetical protein HYY12_02600, partial [Candidatus Methylomirabilis oxyfera]|nr:hypothetical protein [Candidatus Methylomirabilis oxyfera]